jgi:hypothetical protein
MDDVPNKWTEAIETELKKLWHDGNSASETARKINIMFGVVFTRNSIIGKVFRLVNAGKMLARHGSAPKFPTARQPNAPRKKRIKVPVPYLGKPDHSDTPPPAVIPAPTTTKPPVPAPTTTKPPVPAFVRPEPYAGNVVPFSGREAAVTGPTTLEHVRECLYSIGVNSKNQHVFCNEKKRDGSSYCAEHHEKCHVPTSALVIKKPKKWRPF